MCQDVALQELQDSRHSCHFETECHKNLALLLEDGLPCKPVMPDSNHNRLHEERCDVLKLRGEEHACNSDQVQLRQIEQLFRLSDISVHVLHCEEERLLAHLEGREHLKHPIDHASSAHLGDPVSRQMGWRSRFVVGCGQVG